MNLSSAPAQARVPLPWQDLTSRTWRLTDLLHDVTFERDGDELVAPGLFVGLDPWQCHLLAVD